MHKAKNRHFSAVAIFFCATFLLANTAQASYDYSTSITGFLGLNTVPNARMDQTGTVRAGVATLDPYMHSYIGVQIARPLYVSIRQTAEISNITETAEQFYPGVDLKLRLLQESEHRPEIAIGLQSAIGHKKMAGEYIALSKRYHNFDITAGLGWGRFGTAKHLDNPLKNISNHFRKNRNPNSENTNGPGNWFSGDSIGFFAGLEYFLPYDGLSLKLDYGADRYSAEKNSDDYISGAPWGVGLAYTHDDWASAQIGLQGTDKIMARLSLQSKPSDWSFGHKKEGGTAERKPSLHKIESDGERINALLDVSPYEPAPQQIGRAFRQIAAHADSNIAEINVTPQIQNLRGETIQIARKNVENLWDKKDISPEELWKNIRFITAVEEARHTHPFLSTKGIRSQPNFVFILDNELSLSEKEAGALYRSAFLVGTKVTFSGVSGGHIIAC